MAKDTKTNLQKCEKELKKGKLDAAHKHLMDAIQAGELDPKSFGKINKTGVVSNNTLLDRVLEGLDKAIVDLKTQGSIKTTAQSNDVYGLAQDALANLRSREIEILQTHAYDMIHMLKERGATFKNYPEHDLAYAYFLEKDPRAGVITQKATNNLEAVKAAVTQLITTGKVDDEAALKANLRQMIKDCRTKTLTDNQKEVAKKIFKAVGAESVLESKSKLTGPQKFFAYVTKLFSSRMDRVIKNLVSKCKEFNVKNLREKLTALDKQVPDLTKEYRDAQENFLSGDKKLQDLKARLKGLVAKKAKLSKPKTGNFTKAKTAMEVAESARAANFTAMDAIREKGNVNQQIEVLKAAIDIAKKEHNQLKSVRDDHAKKLEKVMTAKEEVVKNLGKSVKMQESMGLDCRSVNHHLANAQSHIVAYRKEHPTLVMQAKGAAVATGHGLSVAGQAIAGTGSAIGRVFKKKDAAADHTDYKLFGDEGAPPINTRKSSIQRFTDLFRRPDRSR